MVGYTTKANTFRGELIRVSREDLGMSVVEKEHSRKSRIVAREWLYLLASMFVGWVILPLVIVSVMFQSNNTWSKYKDYLEGLFRGEGGFWFIALAPYVALQLVRSTIWSVKAQKRMP